jgi:lysosomal acid lipase/cholesteryl ester hydrolase
MPRVPFIGRLFFSEYLALVASFGLLIFEVIARTVTLLLPGPIVRLLYRLSRNAFNSLSSPNSRRNRNKRKSVSSPIAQASDFVELCELYGYYAEEHIVQTGDGYLLGVHRLGWRRGEEEQRVNAGPGSVEKKVVYLHHGLMMNSEVWVCLTDRERCLPFVLVEQGYDVWLGNNRGNKYSKKSLHHSPTDIPFWSFSMDQFAFHDIPDTIDYILSTTKQPSLSYIGFSQGTAQAFASLSIHPTLNDKVDVFVALAPAMAPPGLASGIVASFVKSSPEILYLAFGRRAILGSATMWQALLYPGIFTYFIDKSLSFLFNWKTQNITAHQKLAAYPHLYSFSSVKSVVHWFQIIRNGTFQMFDDEVAKPLAMSNGNKYYKVAKFPTRNIKTPIVLVYGGSDSLVDINLMLKELPKHTVAKEIQKYEHLDLLWASDVDTLVFPHVLEALETYALPAKTKLEKSAWKGIERGILERSTLTSPNGSLPPNYSDSEHNRRTDIDERRRNEAYDWGVEDIAQAAEEHLDESEDEDDSAPERFALTPKPGPVVSRLPAGRAAAHVRVPTSLSVRSDASSHGTVIAKPSRRIRSPRARDSPSPQQQNGRREDEVALPTSPLSAEAMSERTERGSERPSRPEGWWSSTDNSSAAESDADIRSSSRAVDASPSDASPSDGRQARMGVRQGSGPVVVDARGSPGRGARESSRGSNIGRAI